MNERSVCMKMILIYFIAWLGLAVIAILNGTFRVKGYAPYMSDLAAHQVSTLIGLGLFGIFFWFLTRFFPLESSRQALGLGGMWLVLTILFEFVFGHFVMGHSWYKLFADYNIFEGRLWSLILLWIFFGPYVFFKIRQ
jgi:hypothetical protein